MQVSNAQTDGVRGGTAVGRFAREHGGLGYDEVADADVGRGRRVDFGRRRVARGRGVHLQVRRRARGTAGNRDRVAARKQSSADAHAGRSPAIVGHG